jgi:alpha-1,6-mannosyltransferase
MIFWGGCEADHPPSLIDAASALCLNAAIESDIFYAGEADPVLRCDLQGGDPNAVVILSTSRLDPIQQVDGIIRACAILIREGHPLRLVIAGDGQASHDLQRLASTLLPPQRYAFIGRKTRQEIGGLLRASDIFIMNPAFTSYSLALKEALSCGTYAIAPLTGTVAKSIRPDDFATTFAPSDSRALQDALRAAITENRFQKSQAPGAIAIDHHWSDVAESILQWYARTAPAEGTR